MKKVIFHVGIVIVVLMLIVPFILPDANMTEDEAMDILVTTLGGIPEDNGIISQDGTLGDEPCWIFAVGENTAEKFTTENKYAVTYMGKVYIMDHGQGGIYVPYTE